MNPNQVNFNIENLVELLDIIIGISNRKYDFYPFVGSWEKDVQSFIDRQRSEGLVADFKEVIVKELCGDWLNPPDWKQKSAYYKKLIGLKDELAGFPLKIFTLNYDLCVEQNLKDRNLELGFDEHDNWSARRYDYGDTSSEIDFYLYKLHGSINWKKTKNEGLIKTEGDIKTDERAIIFGLANKLQSYDPYLFYFYEFREHCSSANLIISSGYGFMDDHINDAIKYGLKDCPDKKLIVNILEKNQEEEKIKEILSEKLKIANNQIVVHNKSAKEFFNDELKLEKFTALFEDQNTEELPANF